MVWLLCALRWGCWMRLILTLSSLILHLELLEDIVLFIFLNERAQIVRNSINREGETSESHGRLSKATKKEKMAVKKLYKVWPPADY